MLSFEEYFIWQLNKWRQVCAVNEDKRTPRTIFQSTLKTSVIGLTALCSILFSPGTQLGTTATLNYVLKKCIKKIIAGLTQMNKNTPNKHTNNDV
jgi:hypothetical protein